MLDSGDGSHRQPSRDRQRGRARGRSRGAAPRVAEAARMAGGGRGRATAPRTRHQGCARSGSEAGREPAELYRGARLAAALDWAAEHDVELNELERSFLAESQGASEAESRRIRRTNRRLRLLLAGAVVFLAAAVAGGSFAVFQSIEAQRESDRAARAARIARLRERRRRAGQLQRRSGGKHSRGGRGYRDHASGRWVRAARGVATR